MRPELQDALGVRALLDQVGDGKKIDVNDVMEIFETIGRTLDGLKESAPPHLVHIAESETFKEVTYVGTKLCEAGYGVANELVHIITLYRELQVENTRLRETLAILSEGEAGNG